MNNTDLEYIAHETRIDICNMFYHAGWGHLAPALSCTDILTAIYFGSVSQKYKENKMIMSKGHACAVWYCMLARTGAISRDELNTFYCDGSRLNGLADCGVPGIDIPTGSLGHGLSFGTGVAMSYKMDRKPDKVFVLFGDGESQEGTIWEASVFAVNKKLDNLIAVLDFNGLQSGGRTEDISPSGDVSAKWTAIGWTVYEVDGNNVEIFDQLLNDICNLEDDGRPKLIIAKTIKGKGVSIAENSPLWHSRAPKGDEWKSVCKDLGISMERLTEKL